MPLHVALLWHMHQPYYVDPVRGAALMPWVRLHATKGYLDMIWLVDQIPEVRCTFNLTPVLVHQINQLANGQVKDLWHELAATPAESLSPDQKNQLLEYFFQASWDNMIRPHTRYWSLLQKRGTRVVPGGFGRIAGSFSEQEFRDLQAWFNLTWFGYAADHLYPEISELKRKGGNFTEDDKQTIFSAQQDVLKNVLGYYRAVADRGQIEISTTPFYHPILPLVHNTEFARRCQPGDQLPTQFSRPEDVRAQLIMARDLHTQVFGKPPRGLWPSEGSVCPELIPIFQELGFEWFATDEDVLWRSLATLKPGQPVERNVLFQSHRATYADAAIGAAFRDRTLSDFVGFSASRTDASRAAAFMLGHLAGISDSLADEEPLCAVVLDGENAWEHFPDGGQSFLRQFYEGLARHQDLRTTTFHDYFATHPPTSEIPTLHTGSWINGNFRIWIGHPEDNRAWGLLGRTRTFLQGKIDRGELSAEQQRQALDEIYAAEGSDWFWWYGDEFVTDNDLIFDELFRTHLQNIYTICGTPIPDILKAHICRSETIPTTATPTALITPTIDGKVTSFYEWTGAAVYEAGQSMGAMYRTERLIEAIHFGFNQEQMFIRVDLRKGVVLPDGTSLRINFIDPKAIAVDIPAVHPGIPKGSVLLNSNEAPGEATLDIRIGDIIEMGLPFEKFGWRQRDQVTFFVQLLNNGVDLEKHPEIGVLTVTIPDELFEAENWQV